MNPETILRIIVLSLEITLEIIKGIPVASREKIWTDHERRMEFWYKLFEKFSPDAKEARVEVMKVETAKKETK